VESKGRFAGLVTLGAVLASLMTALATNGEKTLAVLGGVPKLLSAWSSALPLGTGSVVLAVVFGTCLWLFLLPRLPRAADGGRAQLLDDNIVILVVLLLVVSQQLIGSAPNTTGKVLMAVTLGGIGGFVACWLGRVIRSAWVHWVKREAPPCKE
jgi:hypothetical protein